MNFRRATNKDTKAIYEVIRQCADDMASRGLMHWIPYYPEDSIGEDIIEKTVFIVEDDDRVVATFTLTCKNFVVSISKLAVLPQISGKGIGTECLRFIEEYCRRNKIKEITLDVYDQSEKAIHFYNKNGYRKTGEKQTRRFTVFEMKKDLANQKKVLILGGGLLQSYVIKRAKELGYEVHVIDANPNSLGFKYADKYAVVDIVDQKACLKYAKENNINGVLTAATDYGVLSASYIAKCLNLKDINYDVAKTIKNKYEVRKTLSTQKADDVDQFFELGCLEDIEKIAKKVKYPVIVKPCDGSGSKAIARVDNIKELEAAAEKALSVSLSKKVLVESFIEGKEYGVESFVYNGEIYVLVVMDKEMTAPPNYAELGHNVPSGLQRELEEKVVSTVKKSIKALGVNFGAVNMDLLVTIDGRVCIIDVGARMGGNLIGSHIVPLSTGIDYMGNIIKAAVGDEVDFTKVKNDCVSTKLLALTPGKVKELPDFNKYYDDDIKYVVCNLNIGDSINEYHNNLDGCGYIVAVGNNPKKLREKVSKIKDQIDKEIVRE